MAAGAGAVVAVLDLDTRSFRVGIQTAERDGATFQCQIGSIGASSFSNASCLSRPLSSR
ncbi:hypothetical protein M2351_002038 [Azospirillum canadense]|nr:hypothetical protein [Azospirillum canadense]